MKKNPSNLQLILVGHLYVNVPVLLLLLGIPVLAWKLSAGLNNLGYQFIIAAFGMLIGFKLAWIWWSVFITKWRINAFSAADEDNWISLKKMAVKTGLIWPEGYDFEKTELRSPEQQQKIMQIKERIFELEQIEEIKHDLRTPDKICFHYNNKDVGIELFVRFFVVAVAVAIIVFSNAKIVGIALLPLILLIDMHYKYITHFGRKDIVFSISNKGLDLKVPEMRFIKWEEIDYLVVNKEDRYLNINFVKGASEDELKLRLQYFDIKSLDEFASSVDVFMERYRMRAFDL